MTLKMEKISANYRVELGLVKFARVAGLGEQVQEGLAAAGAINVSMGGHAGPVVLFSATQDRAPAVLKALNQLLSRRPKVGGQSTPIAT